MAEYVRVREMMDRNRMSQTHNVSGSGEERVSRKLGRAFVCGSSTVVRRGTRVVLLMAAPHPNPNHPPTQPPHQPLTLRFI